MFKNENSELRLMAGRGKQKSFRVCNLYQHASHNERFRPVLYIIGVA